MLRCAVTCKNSKKITSLAGWGINTILKYRPLLMSFSLFGRSFHPSVINSIQYKKGISETWKKEQTIWEDYRKIARVGRDVTRKAKANLELSLAEDIKDIKKGFTYISAEKGRLGEIWGCCWLSDGCPGHSRHREGGNIECLLCLSLHSWGWLSGLPELWNKRRPEKNFPQVVEGWVRDQLGRLNVHKSIKLDGMHPWVLRELKEVVTLLFSTTFEKSRRIGEVPNDWRKASINPIFKQGKKEDLWNYQQVSLTSIPGKVME